MKRFWSVFVVLLLILSLWGCAQQEQIFEIERNGTMFSVDTENRTISDGSHTYHYMLSYTASSSSVTITYPNGSSFYDSVVKGGSGSSSWSDDYKDDAYVSGWTLSAVVRQTIPKPAHTGKIIAGLFLIVLGIFDLAFPQVSWYLGFGWYFKNAEPSDAALICGRVVGVIVMIFGVVLMLTAIGG